ncbi:MAG TPA: hypothetical protein VJH06_02035 [Candidatus Paceibacterota bacterium]
MKREHLVKIKKVVNIGGEGISLAQRMLCAVAFGENLASGFYNSPEAKQIFRGFRRYKFVRYVKEDGKYELTGKGEKKLQYILIDEVVIKTPKKWDGKWRLVMYDLPIRFKNARNAFRWKLKDMGFYQFQKSAWIYPYPCEGELLFVADFFGVRKYVEILEISKVLDDKKLRSHFGL